MPVRDRARAAPEGSGCGPAAPATIGGRQAGAVPPVPRPLAAAMRAMLASAAGSGALLRAGAYGPPSGSGRGSGILMGPAGVAGVPGATTGAASQAPLRGAGTGGSGPSPTAGLPLAKPTGTARPGAEFSAPGGESPPHGIERAPQQGGGGGQPDQAESLISLGLMGPGGQLHRPPPFPQRWRPRWQHHPRRRCPGPHVGVARMSDIFSVISRALTASRAPLGFHRPTLRCTGEGRGGGVGSMMGEAPASAPPLLSPLSPPQEAAEVQPARDAGAGALAPERAAPQAPGSSEPQPHIPPPAQRAKARRVGQRRPMQTLCDPHRAPACKSCRGHRGVRPCCSRHHEGLPRLVLAAGGVRQRTLFGLPPWGGGA